MSKRAEELADDFREWMVSNCVWPMDHDYSAMRHLASMIDAELRKERERCAERATKAYDGSGRLRNYKAMQAAILSEEE